jgi:hypothetical protein
MNARKHWTKLNKMDFLKGIRCYEACISQTRRQNTHLKSSQNILWGIKYDSKIEITQSTTATSILNHFIRNV